MLVYSVQCDRCISWYEKALVDVLIGLSQVWRFSLRKQFETTWTAEQGTRLQIATALHVRVGVINYHSFRHHLTACQQPLYCASLESLTTWLYVEALLILRSNIHMITFKSQKSSIYSSSWQLILDWITLLQLQLLCNCNIVATSIAISIAIAIYIQKLF